MSGWSMNAPCPNCGTEKNCNVYGDRRPFDYTIYRCLSCGLIIQPEAFIESLEQVNYERVEMDMKPLKRLKKGNLNDYWNVENNNN